MLPDGNRGGFLHGAAGLQPADWDVRDLRHGGQRSLLHDGNAVHGSACLQPGPVREVRHGVRRPLLCDGSGLRCGPRLRHVGNLRALRLIRSGVLLGGDQMQYHLYLPGEQHLSMSAPYPSGD
jgi:hypothetical protein